MCSATAGAWSSWRKCLAGTVWILSAPAARRAASPSTVSLNARSLAPQNDLHWIAVVAQHADVQVALGARVLEAAHDLQERLAAITEVEQVNISIDLRARDRPGVFYPLQSHEQPEHRLGQCADIYLADRAPLATRPARAWRRRARSPPARRCHAPPDGTGPVRAPPRRRCRSGRGRSMCSRRWQGGRRARALAGRTRRRARHARPQAQTAGARRKRKQPPRRRPPKPAPAIPRKKQAHDLSPSRRSQSTRGRGRRTGGPGGRLPRVAP